MASLSTFDVGDVVRVGNHAGTNDDGTARAAFATVLGVVTDPTAVTLKVLRPDGSTKTYGWPAAGPDGTLTKESTGRFFFDVSIDLAGVWHWNLAGTGAVQSAEEGAFSVRLSAFP